MAIHMCTFYLIILMPVIYFKDYFMSFCNFKITAEACFRVISFQKESLVHIVALCFMFHGLLQCERRSFTLQKTAYWSTKDGLLQHA